MKLLSKVEIDTEFGKYSFFSGKAGNSVIAKVKYVAGIEIIDKLATEKGIDINKLLLNFIIRPKGLEITFLLAFNNYRVGIPFDKINYWTIKHQEDVSIRKSKSIIGRALLGGLILGPVGAIVSGMTGIKDKEIKLNDADNLLFCSFNLANKERIVIFSCENNHIVDVKKFLKNNFGELLKMELS